MTTPPGTLTRWTCDSCHEPIEGADRGLAIWRTDLDDGPTRGQHRNFGIVHRAGVVGNPQNDCGPSFHEGFYGHVDLDRLLGADGLAHLLSLLDAGPVIGGHHQRVADFPGYVDLVRRVQTPHYEEARSRLRHDTDTRDRLGDANEYHPYTAEILEQVAARSL